MFTSFHLQVSQGFRVITNEFRVFQRYVSEDVLIYVEGLF